MQTYSLGPEHWQTEDLLPRYADLLKAGKDAAAVYPEAAAHLRQCPICRNTLTDILTPAQTGQRPTNIKPSDVPAIRLASDQLGNQRRQTWSYQIQFSMFSMPDPEIVRSSPVAETEIGTGSSLLYYGEIEILGSQYLAMFTFQGVTKQLGRIIGELAGVDPVPAVAVDLSMPGFISTTTSRNGKIIFDDIPHLSEEIRASITIRSIK
jgi:hypothetical protein